MNAEYLQLTRRVNLEASGGADSITIEFESGTPYRHLAMWIYSQSVPNLTAQPLYGGVNDGSSTNVNTAGMTKVFQAVVDEIRPATRGINKHPSDGRPAFIVKPALKITNNAANPILISIYMIAAATPGGA
jgi:hypothetical protein